MKKLLVPIDFSEGTEKVLQAAGELAGQLSAGLLLFHVVEPVATYVPVGASMDVLTATPPIDTVDLKDVEHRLEELGENARKKGITVHAAAIVGLAVDDIVAKAEAEGADYIVLGSHGHGALYHLFSGSVVTGVLRKAKCPVLIIPAREESK